MTTWGAGEYELMAQRLDPAAHAAVDVARIGPQDAVLDLACGTGNAAFHAVDRGARVTGVDLEPALLALARERDADGRVDWLVGDVAALRLPDRHFSAVVSVFGVMYATDATAAARELSRISAPAARIVLAAWPPDSLMPAMGRALGPYLPPPLPGADPPSRWGVEDDVGALLEAAGIELVGADRHALSLSFADRSRAADFFIRTAGHVVSERGRLEAEGRWGDLGREVLTLIDDRARPGMDGAVAIVLDYLLVSARQRAAVD
jgi:SAM-dependent methyltransferase